MSVSVSVSIDLGRLGSRSLADTFLGPQARTEVSNAMGLGVREITRAHLAQLAATRHTTSERLGASPSNFLAGAARAVEAAPIEADASSATMTINHVGLGRAFHDVTIAPTNAKALTIPIADIAYNRRAGQLAMQGWVLFAAKGVLFGRQGGQGAPIALYALVRSVTQRQDRTLLPSNEEWEKAAGAAALNWWDRKIATKAGGA